MNQIFVKYKTEDSQMCSSYYTNPMNHEDACEIEDIIKRQPGVVYTELVHVTEFSSNNKGR